MPFAHEEFYHTYNRGTEKRVIFKDHTDHIRFSELLYLANTSLRINVRDIRKTYDSVFDFDRGEPLVHIGAYCLMPNHFHILLTPAVEGGVQTFMLKLSTAYSMYFNKRYDRNGTLFQGRFKSQHVDSDEYLKYLFAYIHLNPVKLIQSDWKEAGIQNLEKTKAYLSQYEYSSLREYLGITEKNGIIDSEKFPAYFINRKEVDNELMSWLSYKNVS